MEHENEQTKTQPMTQAMTHFGLVGEFHTVFDYPVRTEPYLDVFDEDPKLLKSRDAFMCEERDEFQEAHDAEDLVEMADALCDLDYFAYGSGQCLGIDLDAELRQAGFPDITRTPAISTDVKKDSLNQKDQIVARLAIVSGHITAFETAIAERDFDGLRTSLTNIVIATNQLGFFLNFDLDRMFREVHRSNMTKVCQNLEDAEESVRRYEEEGRYKLPVARTKGKYFMVYDEDLNKILKNYKWEVPNLTQFMGPEFVSTNE